MALFRSPVSNKVRRDQIINNTSKKVILIGQSLGTGVTISYCHNYKYNPEMVILISPFKSIISIISDSIESSSNSIGISPFNSIGMIKSIKCQN